MDIDSRIFGDNIFVNADYRVQCFLFDFSVYLQDRQRDIESRSKIVSSVLKLCTQIQTATHTPESTSTTQTNGLDRRKSAADTTSYSKPIAPCTNGDRRKSDADTSDTLRVVAQNLETRWHGIWLQSLEWQYRLEEAISSGKVGQVCYYCSIISD